MTLLLAATTLVFGASTLHYASATKQQRARNELALSATFVQPETSVPAQAVAVHQTIAGDDPQQIISAAASDNPAGGSTGRDPVSLALAHHRLAELRDPQARAQRAKEFIAMFGDWEAVAPHIGLSPDELTRFLQAFVDRLLQRQQSRLECQIDPACDLPPLQAAAAAAEQDRADLLGPDRYARLKAFQRSGMDRNFVELLNRRLPAQSRLSEVQAGRLALGLTEERERFAAEAQLAGKTSRRYQSGYLVLAAAATPGAPDEHAQLSSSMTEFSQRLYNRAAGLLTGTQLARFQAMQDDSLAYWLEHLRDQEIVGAIRRDAMREIAHQ